MPRKVIGWHKSPNTQEHISKTQQQQLSLTAITFTREKHHEIILEIST